MWQLKKKLNTMQSVLLGLFKDIHSNVMEWSIKTFFPHMVRDILRLIHLQWTAETQRVRTVTINPFSSFWSLDLKERCYLCITSFVFTDPEWHWIFSNSIAQNWVEKKGKKKKKHLQVYKNKLWLQWSKLPAAIHNPRCPSVCFFLNQPSF